MLKLIGCFLRLIFPFYPADTRKQYRVRCISCYKISGQRFDPVLTENERHRIISCTHCGQELHLTIPIATEESPDDAAPV